MDSKTSSASESEAAATLMAKGEHRFTTSCGVNLSSSSRFRLEEASECFVKAGNLCKRAKLCTVIFTSQWLMDVQGNGGLRRFRVRPSVSCA